MSFVVIESPYSGCVAENEAYARQCMADSLKRGESPFLSHLLYTQVLDDTDEVQRNSGIQAGIAVQEYAEKVVFYLDRGFSKGMEHGLRNVIEKQLPYEFRRLDG